jgi:MFS family permease
MITDTAPIDGTRAWLTAGACTAVLGAVLGIFGSIGVLVDPLAVEFGAPRAQLGLLFTAALAVHSAAAHGAGRAVLRWGPRPALAGAAAGTGLGLLAPATAGSAWVAIGGYGLGMGLASACAWVATTAVVGAAFEHRRTAALGLLAAGPAAGGVVVAPAAAALAAAAGPRVACAVLAVAGAAVCVAGAALLGHRPDGPGSSAPAAAPDQLRFIAAGLVMGLVVFVPLVHIAGRATDLGLTPVHGAALLAVTSAVSAAARLGAGWLAAPGTLPRIFLGCHVLVAVAFAVWAVTGPAAAFPMLVTGAVLFGAGYGAWLSTGPAMLAATTDPRRLARTLGTYASAVGIGGVIGPALAGPALTTAPALVLGGCAAVATLAAVLLDPWAFRCGRPECQHGGFAPTRRV